MRANKWSLKGPSPGQIVSPLYTLKWLFLNFFQRTMKVVPKWAFIFLFATFPYVLHQGFCSIVYIGSFRCLLMLISENVNIQQRVWWDVYRPTLIFSCPFVFISFKCSSCYEYVWRSFYIQIPQFTSVIKFSRWKIEDLHSMTTMRDDWYMGSSKEEI